MKRIKYTFNEDIWDIFVIEGQDETINLEHHAEVRFEDKQLLIRREQLNIQTLLHELWHIYFGYCFLQNTSEVTAADLEEISATMFSNNCERMLTKAKDMITILKGL